MTGAAGDGAMRALEREAERGMTWLVDRRWAPLPGIMTLAAAARAAVHVRGQTTLVRIHVARSTGRIDPERDASLA
jgi:hypothetical protein